jgi:hypothetical protein
MRITSISGSELRGWRLAKPIYKLWIEAVCPPGLRGYLHHTTGIYYTTAAVSVFIAAFALVVVAWLLWAIIKDGVQRGWALIPSFLLTDKALRSYAFVAGFSVLARVSYLMSKRCVQSITREGRVAMQLEESRDDIGRLAWAATRASAA